VRRKTELDQLFSMALERLIRALPSDSANEIFIGRAVSARSCHTSTGSACLWRGVGFRALKPAQQIRNFGAERSFNALPDTLGYRLVASFPISQNRLGYADCPGKRDLSEPEAFTQPPNVPAFGLSPSYFSLLLCDCRGRDIHSTLISGFHSRKADL
jgi:hypothetical protein